MRLNCVTQAYGPLWEELYDDWWATERWAIKSPGLPSLEVAKGEWTWDAPLRTDHSRRAALIEIDVLAALMLGLGLEELIAIYTSRFPQLVDYENEMWFDGRGRRLAANFNQWGHGQAKEHYAQLMAHLDEGASPPEGYVPPFYKADRVREMREAHAVFSERLARAQEGAGSG